MKIVKKKYERPSKGEFVGVIADVVDLGVVPTQFGPKKKLRIVWILNANDSEGRPFSVIQSAVQSLHPRAALFNIVSDILGEAPPEDFETDTLITVSRRLYIETRPDVRTGEPYPFVKGIMPLTPGQPAMTIPAGFVRAQDKPKSSFSYGNQTAPAPAPAPAQQAQQAAPVPQEEVVL